MAEEEGSGAADGARSNSGDCVAVLAGGNAHGGALSGEGVGEYGLGVAVGDEADIGDGRGTHGLVVEEGADGLVQLGVVGWGDCEGFCAGDADEWNSATVGDLEEAKEVGETRARWR